MLRYPLCFLLLCSCAVGQGKVQLVAGNGKKATSGDGKHATQAGVSGPFGVEIGPRGALYVCETTGHRIRRVDQKTGRITTVAGTGKSGYSGDGKLATNATLNEPYEVRFDTAGNMYFVEMKNHVVRRVDAKTNIISTVAGTGEAGFSGDGGPAIKARLKRPHSIELDRRGRLFICDIGNHRIRVVDLKSGVISTFAGTGKKARTPDGSSVKGTPLNGPRALVFDPGNDHRAASLILALREGNAIYRINLKSNTLHHIAGSGKKGYTGDGGPAKQARLAGPKGVAVDRAGNIYLADTESHTIRVIDRKSATIRTLIGDGKRGNGAMGNPKTCRLDRPHGVCVEARTGAVFVGDSNNHRVVKWSR